MNKATRDLLAQCLLECTLDEIREIEANDYSHIYASQELKDRIKNDIDAMLQKKKKCYPKRIALILVATLTVCFLILFTISAQIRNAVIGFFVEVYETFATILVENDNDINAPETIETEYKSTYFEENEFKQTEKTNSSIRIFTTWSKDDSVVYFSQNAIHENDIISDIEETDYDVTYINDIEVYYKIKNSTYSIKWLAYGYSFNIRCNDSFEWEEIEKIITSLEPVTE